jgi:hypothetical protein
MQTNNPPPPPHTPTHTFSSVAVVGSFSYTTSPPPLLPTFRRRRKRHPLGTLEEGNQTRPQTHSRTRTDKDRERRIIRQADLSQRRIRDLIKTRREKREGKHGDRDQARRSSVSSLFARLLHTPNSFAQQRPVRRRFKYLLFYSCFSSSAPFCIAALRSRLFLFWFPCFCLFSLLLGAPLRLGKCGYPPPPPARSASSTRTQGGKKK